MKYHIGMYGGSFNPLHTGHVHCIIQGANLCEELYIVLSIGINRNEIDYRIRYRWLYQLTKHIGNVKILVITDDAVTKADYIPKYWLKDAEYIKAQIGKPIDVIFCGSDYSLNSIWHTCYSESEIVIFTRVGVNSTALRKNPYTHWNWLPNIVKPYYVKKVLITGSESTGKSTLTINLANYFNTNYIHEAGRDISQRSGTDMLMISADFTEILLKHKLNELKALQHSNRLLFIDTDALTTQFYLEFLNDGNKDKNKNLSNAIDALNEYSLILFLEPDVAFVQDGDRSKIIQNNRNVYSEQIKELFQKHNQKFVSISGDYQTRYLTAISLVETMMI